MDLFTAVIPKFQCLHFITNGGVHQKQTDESLGSYDFFSSLAGISICFLNRQSGHHNRKVICTRSTVCYRDTKSKEVGLSIQACGIKTTPVKGLRVRMYQVILNALVQLC